MIIKSMPRKEPSFGQLLKYILTTDQPGPTIGHNLASDLDDPEAVHREFLDTFRYLPQRKNGNVLYHEVLSFSAVDQPNVTASILEDLTAKYLDLRAPYAVAYAHAHLDTDCPHVHIMISANNHRSDRRVSLSRAEFAKVKKHLEQYQRDRYPFLERSVVYERKTVQARRPTRKLRQGRSESERDRRLAKEGRSEPSRKEQIRELVVEQLMRSLSAKGFFHRLKRVGLHLYKHGKHVGVHDLVGDPQSLTPGRRYRLMTLDLQDGFKDALRQWKTLPKRLMVLERQELTHEHHLWQTRDDYGHQIQEVMTLHSSELSPLERDRLEQIRLLRASCKQGRTGPEQDR